jgi:hypothetical protein
MTLCPNCERKWCDHVQCYLAEPEHEPEEHDTGITIDELRKKYGSLGLTEVRGDPLLGARETRRAA